MFKLHHDKRHHGVMWAIPMLDEDNYNKFSSSESGTWVYFCDGKKHGSIPAIVLPSLIDIFGGEDIIRQAGYRKHWIVFEDTRTSKCYFGNYPSFSKSSNVCERRRAENMMEVDIKTLMCL